MVPVEGPSSLALATVDTTSTPVENPLGALLKSAQEKGGDSVDTGIPTEDPKKQWWIRKPTSPIRKKAEKIAVMRAAGHKDAEIAKRLKTTAGTVQQMMFLARKNHWLDDDDEPVDLELEMAMTVDRKVVRNLNASLDGQMTNWQTHETTLAAAKGRGHFKTHEVSAKESGQGMSVVAIQVIMPPVGAGDQKPEVREDQMGGAPLYLEGDLEGEPHEQLGGLEAAASADSEGPAAVSAGVDMEATDGAPSGLAPQL